VAVNQEFVGKTFFNEKFELFEVGREKVKEFALALGETNPIYFNKEHAQSLGFSDIVAPPTFLISVAMSAMNKILFDPKFNLDYSRIVHGEQGFTLHKPVVAGMQLAWNTTLESVVEKVGNEFLTFNINFGEPDGFVAQLKSVLISRGEA
jgi:hypothetical protein